MKRVNIKNTKSNSFYRNYFVDTNVQEDGNGTVQNPFKTINKALFHSLTQKNACKVNIRPGIYNENVNISRPTILCGTIEDNFSAQIIGSIVNTSISPLVVKNLMIKQSRTPGAIFIKHKNADTLIHNVNISNATRYGIFQSGGKISLSEVNINNTAGGNISECEIESQFSIVGKYGTAINLENANGNLNNVSLRNNFQGLIGDKNCTLNIESFFVRNTKVNPDLITHLCNNNTLKPCGCAILADRGTNVSLNSVSITDGEYLGVFVTNASKMIANNLSVYNTRGIGCGLGGGINISVKNNSHMEISDFSSSYAGLAGIQVINSYCKVQQGRIHHCPIGVHIIGQIDSFETVQVTYENNDRNLDSDELPIPDITTPI